MSFLSNLTDNQRTTLVSLPYRVGLWVSQSDQSGGVLSDSQELQVLSNIINGFAEDMFGSEVVQMIMTETVRRKSEWGAWAQQVSSVPEDCRFAVDVLGQYADTKDITAFTNHLMQIAEAVALAFREYEDFGVGKKISMHLAFYASLFKARPPGLPRRTLREYLSISTGERSALGALARSLGTTYI
jgi:hypothetical protein